MLNSVSLMGRISEDPDFRYTPSKTPVALFTIACERDFTGQDKERKTDFIDCVAWRGAAEFVQKHFRKGSMIAVTGRIQVNSWKDKENNLHEKTEIHVDNVYFGESANKGKEG